MTEQQNETAVLDEAVAELRLWLDGQRSMTNFIRGSLGGHEGDAEIESRLIWEADNAQIVARAALVNAAAARLTRPGSNVGGDS
jgi:hypothetical protein